MRLGVYADLLYHRQGDELSTDRAFVLFVCALADHLDELVLLGRLDPEPGRSFYVLPPVVRFVPLPHYARLSDVGGALRSLRGALRTFRRELDRLDGVLLFGPHPAALLFALVALGRRKRILIGVRQDMPKYVANRLPGARNAWALALAHGFEAIWVLLARWAPAIVVGDELGRRYRRAGGRVLATGFSLVRAGELVPLEEAIARAWDGDELRLLSVGRLDAEKNPLLLAEILAALLRNDPRWRLDVVGQGPLEGALRRRAKELGVDGDVLFHGYVSQGDELRRLYRAANAFLHVSLTEGLPQVLFEAAAAGTPVVATDVGGVGSALAGAGLLVPPRDAGAAASALERLRDEPELRAQLAERGLARAASQTMEAQIARIASFLADPASSST